MGEVDPKNLDYLFITVGPKGYKKYIRCEDCVYAETRADLPANFVHCTKYPYMISLVDKTCKSAVKKEK